MLKIVSHAGRIGGTRKQKRIKLTKGRVFCSKLAPFAPSKTAGQVQKVVKEKTDLTGARFFSTRWLSGLSEEWKVLEIPST
jgi:hypothetical protein